MDQLGDQSSWAGNVTVSDFSTMASELDAEDHLDMFIARESVKFMDRYKDQDQPFFLVSSFMKPHTPLFPPKKYAEKYLQLNIKIINEKKIELSFLL